MPVTFFKPAGINKHQTYIGQIPSRLSGDLRIVRFHHILKRLAGYLRQPRIAAALAVSLIIVAAVLYSALKRIVGDDIVWVPVERGDFVIEHVESGEIRAVEAEFVRAPRERIDLQIVDMAPEGTVVGKGDFLVQFDTAALKEELDQELDVLKQAEADLRSIETNQASRMSELLSNLKLAEYSREAAELRVELLKYESENTQEDARLELKKELIRFDETEKKIEAQKIIDYAERQTAALKLDHAKREVQEIRDRIERLRITAPIRGMVVYQEIGGWNAPKYKVSIGEQVRAGEAIISIPDLTQMKMILQVNEMDVSRLEVGQRADIRLDAFPDSLFHGTVSTIASLIEKQVEHWRPTSRPPSFAVTLILDETSPVLKPGMTAQSIIFAEKIPDVIYVPVGAVYENGDGETVVFTRRRFPDPTPVTLGKRNSRFAVVDEGLDAGDRELSLMPPGGNFHPLGWFAEMERRRMEQRNLLAHIETMEERGITFDPAKADSLRKELGNRNIVMPDGGGGGYGESSESVRIIIR